MAITLIGLFSCFLLSISISNQGLQHLKNESMNDIQAKNHENNQILLKSHLNSHSQYVDYQLKQIANEQQILSGLVQNQLDAESDLNKRHLEVSPATPEKLQDYGSYLQNDENSNTVVLVQNYMLDGKRSPNATTQKLIDKTLFMDSIFVPFYNYGIPKANVYFTGNNQGTFYRAAPWSDLGGAFNKIYPDNSQKSNWDMFYPGLLDQWEAALASQKNEINSSTPLYMEPSQDAVTGNMVISVKSAIWDKSRKRIEGTISYDYSLEELLRQIERIKVSENSFAFLSQYDGTLLAINDSGLKQLKIKIDPLNIKSNRTTLNFIKQSFRDSEYYVVQNIRAPKNNTPEFQSIEINHKKYWVISKQLSSFNGWSETGGVHSESWILGFVVPETDFSLPYERMKTSIVNNANDILLKQIAMMLLLFAAIATALFFLYDKLTRNLRLLIEATQHIKKRRFDVSLDIHTEDEFGILAESFNGMTSEIKATVQQLMAQNELLKGEMGLKDRMDEQIAFMKQYDTLTALPNKQTLYKKIDEYIKRSTTEHHIGALIIIGIDNFKRINEAYGVELGDELLKEIAERLRNEGTADSISRITGDEFGLIFYGLKVLDDLIPRLDALRMIMNKSFEIHGKTIYLTASYGISTFPGDAMSSKEILKNATTALVIAKENKADHYRFYDSTIEQNIQEKVEMMNALRKSIENRELSLVYQPIVDASTGKMVSLEALIRWHNPQYGYIPPSVFIPVAEEILFISQIESFVVEEVMRDLKRLSDNQMAHLYVSINLSAIDLDSDEFMDYLENQIKWHQVAYGRIQLEITEGVLINHYDRIVPRLSKLSKAGIHIALDDFGTGYSSLKYIKRLPIDCLKIDRSFVKDYPEHDDGGIAKIIINLASTFNLGVIAEGVETKEQAQFLLENGCSLHQGYLYGKGITINQLIEQHQTEIK